VLFQRRLSKKEILIFKNLNHYFAIFQYFGNFEFEIIIFSNIPLG
jgi:hypothetical protein